jgi:hypothetical protein
MKRAPVFSACVGSAFLVLVVSLSAAVCTYAQDPPTQEAPPQENPSQQPASQPKPAGRDYQPLGDDQEGTSDSGSILNPDTGAYEFDCYFCVTHSQFVVCRCEPGSAAWPDSQPQHRVHGICARVEHG